MESSRPRARPPIPSGARAREGDTAGRAIMETLVAAVRATHRSRYSKAFPRRSWLATAASSALRARGARRPSARFLLLSPQCWRRAGSVISIASPPIRRRRAESASQWRRAPAPSSPTRNSCGSTRRQWTSGIDPAPLATESLRGEGAIIVDRSGHRFMAQIDPAAELAPRDIVARGVFASIAAGGGAFLDTRAAVGAELPMRFPTVYASCIASGVDPVAGRFRSRPPRIITWERRCRYARTNVARGSLGRGRSRLDRRAWRQSPRLELAARGGGVRGAHRERQQARRASRQRPPPPRRSIKRARPTRASSTNCAM